MRLFLTALIAISSFSAAADIRDEANFFSASALRQAENKIDEIRDAYGYGVTIETYDAIPEENRASYSAENKDAFFVQWMRDRAHATNTDGLFILVCKKPSHLQVGVGQAAAKKGFTSADRDELRDTLVSHFRSRDFDDGLTAALTQASQKFAKISNRAMTAAKPGYGASTPTARSDASTEEGQPVSYNRAPATSEPTQRSIIGSFLKWTLVSVLVFAAICILVIWAVVRGVRNWMGRRQTASSSPTYRDPGPGSGGTTGGGGDF